MIKSIYNINFFIFLILFSCSCTAQQTKTKQNESLSQKQVSVIVPFLPGSCHQCNTDFYRNLKLLEEKSIDYSILLSEEYSEDLAYIKKEYNLSDYKVKDFIFSSSLYETYHVFEQNYVLQFGIDSNYKIYDNTATLVGDLEGLDKAEKIPLHNYSIKKSTLHITVNGTDQICVRNSVRQNAFDFVDLKNNNQPLSISFTDEQLLYHFILNFKDTTIARNKLNQINDINDIPNKNIFDPAFFYNDTLFIFSSHTFIRNLADSALGGFMVLNIYKDGQYLDSRPVNKDNIPAGYTFLPHSHIYKNKLYMELVKIDQKMSDSQPNYFLGMFELVNDAYQFEKMLNFTVPDIHKDVGYSFVELKFSGKYLMTSASNILFNLETEQSEGLNIPINEQLKYAEILNDFKGIDILITNINVSYPNILISYFSKDNSGNGNTVVLNYNLKQKRIVGRINMPLENTLFIRPDASKFGYFIWVPLKESNDYLTYKKLY